MTEKYVNRIKHHLAVWVRNASSDSNLSYEHLGNGFVSMYRINEYSRLLHICDPALTGDDKPWWTNVDIKGIRSGKCSQCNQVASNNIKAAYKLHTLEI